MQCNMQEGIKDGRRLRPGGLVFYRGPDARSHLKLQNIQVLDNKDDFITTYYFITSLLCFQVSYGVLGRLFFLN
jgi:hypothetical protein